MSDALIWLHEDALSGTHPLSAGVQLSEGACYVWDDAHLEEMGYSFKRLVFIYETLVALGVPIYRGDTVAVLKALAASRGVARVRVPFSPNPALQAIWGTLSADLEVECVFELPLVTFDRPPKLRRFFAYWKSARRLLVPSPKRRSEGR